MEFMSNDWLTAKESTGVSIDILNEIFSIGKK